MAILSCDNCEHPDYYYDDSYDSRKQEELEKIAKEFDIDFDDMSRLEKNFLEDELHSRLLNSYCDI